MGKKEGGHVYYNKCNKNNKISLKNKLYIGNAIVFCIAAHTCQRVDSSLIQLLVLESLATIFCMQSTVHYA